MKASNEISSRGAPPAAPRPNGASSSSTAERFALAGPSIVLDARLNAYRRDLADVALAGTLFAPHYVRPLVKSCGMLATFVRDAPSDAAPAVSELLPGEDFAVLDIAAGWAWGYCGADHRVGYVEAIGLIGRVEPTHQVVEAAAPIQAAPDPLSPPLSHLPMGARVRGEARGAMLETEAGFIPASYLRALGDHEEDPPCVARRLLNAPYLPGGRTLHGIDCAGLVQLSLALCGIPAPRDSEDQRGLGEEIAADAPLMRGDLLFCDDHVGMMLDDLLLIHVGPRSGKVSVEPWEAARPPGSCSVIARRRLRR